MFKIFNSYIELNWKRNDMDELLLKYADEFDENFPMYLFRSESEDKIKAMILKCLGDGIPFKMPETLGCKYW